VQDIKVGSRVGVGVGSKVTVGWNVGTSLGDAVGSKVPKFGLLRKRECRTGGGRRDGGRFGDFEDDGRDGLDARGAGDFFELSDVGGGLGDGIREVAGVDGVADSLDQFVEHGDVEATRVEHGVDGDGVIVESVVEGREASKAPAVDFGAQRVEGERFAADVDGKFDRVLRVVGIGDLRGGNGWVDGLEDRLRGFLVDGSEPARYVSPTWSKWSKSTPHSPGEKARDEGDGRKPRALVELDEVLHPHSGVTHKERGHRRRHLGRSREQLSDLNRLRSNVRLAKDNVKVTDRESVGKGIGAIAAETEAVQIPRDAGVVPREARVLVLADDGNGFDVDGPVRCDLRRMSESC